MQILLCTLPHLEPSVTARSKPVAAGRQTGSVVNGRILEVGTPRYDEINAVLEFNFVDRRLERVRTRFRDWPAALSADL